MILVGRRVFEEEVAAREKALQDAHEEWARKQTKAVANVRISCL